MEKTFFLVQCCVQIVGTFFCRLFTAFLQLLATATMAFVVWLQLFRVLCGWHCDFDCIGVFLLSFSFCVIGA